MFPRLKEVDRLRQHWIHHEGHEVVENTEFISFLKDHERTLKKVSTHLEIFKDKQLEEMLSCLEFATRVQLEVARGLKHKGRVRQFNWKSMSRKEPQPASSSPKLEDA